MLFWIHVANHHTSKTNDVYTADDFWWVLQEQDGVNIETLIDQLRYNCIHCRRVPSLIPRPLNVTDIAKFPGAIIHMDFKYINQQLGYLLVGLDNSSRKTVLKQANRAKAYITAQLLLEWRAKFNLREEFILVSDQGSHFCNRLLEYLREHFRFSQKFTIANAPYTSGSVETVNSDILTILKQLTSEYKLALEEWPILIPIVEYVLNNRKMQRRCGFTPNQLFLGVDEVKLSLEDKVNLEHFAVVNENDEVFIPNSYKNLLECCDNLAKKIEEKVDKVYNYRVLRRAVENKKLNDKRFIFQFHKGDWVMYSNKDTPAEGSKLHMVWIGPYQIIDITGENVYSIRSPLGQVKEVHSSRLWFYSEDEDFQLTPAFVEMFKDSVKFFNVKEILDHKLEEGRLYFKIWWKGFNKIDSTFEEFGDIYPTIPQLMQKYFEKAQFNKNERQILDC